jgi:preprotein translocase subunit SecD
MNKYPLWKNLLLIFVLLIAGLYSLPMLYSHSPAIQISSATPGLDMTPMDLSDVKNLLKQQEIKYEDAELQNKNIFIRFDDVDTQIAAKDKLDKSLGDNYISAISLETATPKWLMALGALPMRLGLDLQGGVHLLLQVDVDSVLQKREKAAVKNIGDQLRDKQIRYAGISPLKSGGIGVRFRDTDTLKQAQNLLGNSFPEYAWVTTTENGQLQLTGTILPGAWQTIANYVIDQARATLDRRVNELGVSEAIVQRQGKDRISVDLPGIQDSTEAKNILGKTATLEFRLVDTQNDATSAQKGVVPAGSELFYDSAGHPVLLKSQILLTGDSITSASAGIDSQSGSPSVNIRLGGGGESLFERVTAENVGKPMSTVYTEIKSKKMTVDGQDKIIFKEESRVINIATIQSALGSSFQVTGLSSPIEARNLALLLRAGALPAPVTVISEETVGPSMGKQNIHQGMVSLMIGMLIIIGFMLLYYRMFGLIANLGLLINLVLLTAILSIIGATLSFPGIAGLILTVGMAVDYNVLIYERIREELRNGMTPQAAIHTGYEKAFVTILDANVTSLIVGLLLFALGSNEVKGFAIVLILGLLTSILSSVTYTRMITNKIYGGKRLDHLSIGIKIKK